MSFMLVLPSSEDFTTAGFLKPHCFGFQWFKVLDGLMGQCWKVVGLVFNCIFLLFQSVLNLIACARWISKLIRKGHESSVTNVSWHPNNTLLATTSTDGKCRVFYAFIKVVDAKDTGGMSSDTRFGELIVQLDLSASWTFSVKWSPKGDTLVYTGQNSMIYFVNNVGSSPVTQSVACRDLPLRDVLFISEKMVIGVGFDCVPAIFVADERGRWSFVRYLGERVSAGAKYSSEFYDAFGRFCGTIRNDAVETSRISEGTHEKCINCILPFRGRGTLIKRFSTSGLDGKVIIWDLERQQDLLEYIINPF